MAGLASDLSEVLVKGSEPAALDARVAPACPAGPPVFVVWNRLRVGGSRCLIGVV